MYPARYRFLETHSLLHQDAVDQLVEPVLVVVEPVDVRDSAAGRGRGPGGCVSTGIGPNLRCRSATVQTLRGGFRRVVGAAMAES